MLSKTVYDQLGVDTLEKGVFDWLYKEDSGLLAAMDTVKVAGNGVKYNVETTDATGAWIDVGDDIPEDTGTFDQRSAALYRLANHADIDKMRIDMDGTQNVEAVEIMRVTRAMKRRFYEGMIWGQTTTASATKQPKGFARLVAEIEGESVVDLDAGNNSQVVANHATSGALTLAKVEEMMDQVKLGCTALLMSAQTLRKMNSLIRAAGTPVGQRVDQFEHNIQTYNGAGIYVLDHIDNNIPDGSGSVLTIGSHNRSATWASGVDNTIIFGAHLAKDGLTMIETPNGAFKKEEPFKHSTKDAWRHRFLWYGGFACFNKFSLAALINVETDASS